MGGRPRKVIEISTGKISKAERASREEQERKVKVEREQLEEVPEWLGENAKEEYKRVVKVASEINLLDNLDKSVVAVYADSYERYIEMAKRMRSKKTLKEFTMLKESANLILKISSKIGLTSIDRLKLIVPVKEESKVNKYLKYIKK